MPDAALLTPRRSRCDVLLTGEQTAHVTRLAAGLCAHGLRVACLDGPRLARQLREEHDFEIPSHAWCPVALRGRHRFGAVRALERCVHRAQLRRLVRRLRPRVVHINSVDPRHALWTELGRDCPPLVATVWGTDIHTLALDGTPRQRDDTARVLGHARVVTADAPYLLDLVRNLCPSTPADLRLVLFGVDVERFATPTPADQAAWTAQLKLEPGRPVVLAPRRINPRYSPERVLEAFAASPAARGGYLVFKLFGDNSAEEREAQQRLQRRAAEMNLGPALRFAAPCVYERLPGLYQRADVACFILDRDGTPSTALELWAAGVPFIAADIPHYRGVIGRHNAVLVTPGDAAAAAWALEQALCAPEVTRPLIQRGREWVRQYGDHQALVRGMLAAYDDAGLPHVPAVLAGTAGSAKTPTLTAKTANGRV